MTMQDLFSDGFERDPRYDAGPGDYSREVDSTHEDIVLLQREVRRLKGRIDDFSSGNKVRATSIQGAIPVANGGSGTTGNVFGAVSMIQNNSGGTLTVGAVLIRNGDRLGTTTTVVRHQDVLGVQDDASVLAGGQARVRQAGYAAAVQVAGTVTAGDYLATSTTVGKAASIGTVPGPGAFAIAMTADAGGLVAAFVFPVMRGFGPFETFRPSDNEPPAAAFATSATRNAHPILEFDDTTDEEAVFGSVLARAYSGAGLTVGIVYLMATATTGTVRWEAAFERHEDDAVDLDADSFAAAQSVGDVVPNVAGEPGYCEIVFTAAQIDGLLRGESYRVKVRRDANGTTGTDDATGDAQLMRVTVRET